MCIYIYIYTYIHIYIYICICTCIHICSILPKLALTFSYLSQQKQRRQLQQQWLLTLR